MAGMLEPELRETVIGHAEVRQVFDLTKGKVAGCYVARRHQPQRSRPGLRKKQPIYDGGLGTLRRFQDDVKEVRAGLECGIKLGDFSDTCPMMSSSATRSRRCLNSFEHTPRGRAGICWPRPASSRAGALFRRLSFFSAAVPLRAGSGSPAR